MSDPHYFPAEFQGTRAQAYQNQISGDLRLSSVSVKQAAMNQRLDAAGGNLTDADPVDVQEYEKNAMYGDKGADGKSFVTRLVMRYAGRYTSQLTDIPAALQSIAGIDLYQTLFDALPGTGNGAVTDIGSPDQNPGDHAAKPSDQAPEQEPLAQTSDPTTATYVAVGVVGLVVLLAAVLYVLRTRARRR